MTSTSRSGSCGVGFVCNINGEQSHEIIQTGIEAVRNLTHRGAVGADGKTGDGAGILMQIPRKFFLKEIERSGFEISDISNLAVGSFFLYDQIQEQIEEILRGHGLKPVGWRVVPTSDDALGESALRTKPQISHLLIDLLEIPENRRSAALYSSRRQIEKKFGDRIAVPSLSDRTLIYKGLLAATHLEEFYPDLSDDLFESAFCMFHQRFSTNTFPAWTLSQPMRMLAHNGEINTIQGNRHWMQVLEHEIRHEKIFDTGMIRPLVSLTDSDSASLDAVIELLTLAGFSIEHAINMCIPPAWENSSFSTEIKTFFHYQSLLMKPWDGPAAIAFTDGKSIGAHMDRNGLRPLRYTIIEDGLLIIGSETGMVDLGKRTIKTRGRLGPGETLSVDLVLGEIKFTEEILSGLARQKPYASWIKNLVRLPEQEICPLTVDADLNRKQIAFGYTVEEMESIIKVVAGSGKEMVYSMGDDTPLPALSEKPQLLFRYFKQRFSQVTNPPIASIRERMVMSLQMNLGCKKNFLEETPDHTRRLLIESPVLTEAHIQAIEEQKKLNVHKIPIIYSTDISLFEAISNLQKAVLEAVWKGAEIIVLSDREISKEMAAMPSLLAVSAAFQYLRRNDSANKMSIVIETGEARDVHHFACLIGYGASAVHPWLAFQTITEMFQNTESGLSCDEPVLNFIKATEDELLKVIARMGISTLSSYHGARLFDSVCLNREFIDEYFTGTSVIIEADGIREIENSLMERHAAGFAKENSEPDPGGDLKQKKGGELHAWGPSSVAALMKFMKNKDYSDFKAFSTTSRERPVYLRHLLFYKKGAPISIEEVEPEDSILCRFVSGAMSVGSLSPEAHETIAEACNALGIRSNSGEGGEDPSRYWSMKNSAIKQVASGRFGVTPTYLASARDLEIKIAQGAKPGEGGHLPSRKVTGYIASLRHCKQYTLLISPPPHHDIYSIEDLAQLIHDLKEANPEARVSVKLVAEAGIGTVAAGVAKAYADIVQISGCEGGTGAAAISSIKNAGSYWEAGLLETQRVLMENRLRAKVRIRVDGGLRTGEDVIIAALLGAEEFGFGTATMIAAGCVMARKCHLDTCPTGIATQNQELRSRFRGKASDIVAYFRAVAREVREILAELGFARFEDIIGRTDLLSLKPVDGIPGSQRLKFTLLSDALPGDQPRRCMNERNDSPAISMNELLIKELMPYIESAEPVEKEYEIRNINRSIPVRLNYHIALKYQDQGLPEDTIRLKFKGTAGQSFGAFNHRGLSLTLVGEANDYAAKGMYGGRIIIRPPVSSLSHEHVIVGNTVLYGATGGELFVSGKAGERFAVRNSGAVAVVEGTGHHLCEYMTGGTVVVLGQVGYNVGAGMNGGVIYVYDRKRSLEQMLNSEYVACTNIILSGDIETLRDLLKKHCLFTESPLAREILDTFEASLKYICKVIPITVISN
jgi:glutamate synthase (NADPH) large chain